MGFLELLQQRRQQGDGLSRALSALGAGLADSITQGKAEAKEQAKLYQQLGGVMLQSGQGKQAADLLPKFREAVKTGYGVDLPSTSVVGAPVMGQVPNPDFIGPMPLGQQAMKRGEVGRDFSGQQTLDAIRGGLMLEPPKPMKVEAGETYVDPVTRKVLFEGKPKPGKLVPSYNADGTITYKEADEGLTVGARPAAPRLFMSYGPDGKATLVEGAAGVTLGVKPSAERDVGAAVRRWEENRLKFVQNYVAAAVRRLPTIVRQGVAVKQAPTSEFIKQVTAQAEATWDASVTRPDAGVKPNFEQPGSGQAAPAVRGVRSSAILPPKDYNDTGLLPEWEALAQQAVSLAPGAAISSKARSKERNANAGGVAGSWHQYRQAFDLAGVKPADKPKLIQWGRQQGLEVIDEGDHLHFEPARSSDAMRNFYAKHGLESDDA